MAVSVPKVVGDILRVAAPTLLIAFGGPIGAVAASIATVALNAWLGPATNAAVPDAPVPIGTPQPPSVGTVTPTEIIDTIMRNKDDPRFLLALKQVEKDLIQYEGDLGFRFADLEERSKQRASDFQIASGTASSLLRWGMGVVVLAISSLLAVMIGSLLLIAGAIRIPAETAQLAVGVFGLVGAITGSIASYGTQVLGFYFGSSAGSTNKTDQIGETMQAMGAALGTAVNSPQTKTPPQVVVVPSTPPVPDDPSAPSNFINFVEKLLDHEGGYVDNPSDPGGCTNMGITLNTLREWRHSPKITCEDVKALTRAEAKEIYFAKYWNALCCDDLPTGVDYITFDFGVNAGVSRAAKTLQQILAKRDPSLKVDGVIGPMTLRAMTKASPRAVVDEFQAARMEFYRSLDGWGTFGRGWTQRASDVVADALGAVNAAA